MKNTKVIALLITAFTVVSISAEWCQDKYGNSVSCTGRAVRGAGKVAGEATEGLANILTLGGVSRAKEREANRSRQSASSRRRNVRRDVQEELETDEIQE